MLGYFILQGIMARVYETSVVLILLAILVTSIVWVGLALIDRGRTSDEGRCQSGWKVKEPELSFICLHAHHFLVILIYWGWGQRAGCRVVHVVFKWLPVK